jgi:DNA-binding NtrC family response regulator
VNVIRVELPPLRRRKEDIPLLVQQFIDRFNRLQQRSVRGIAGEALSLLMAHDWPGNVRELENVIERAVVLTPGPRIGPDLMPEHVRKVPTFFASQFVLPPGGISFRDVITDFEKRLIESTLEAAGGVQKRAAELLHVKPTTLNEMIKRYDINPRRRRASEEAGTEPGTTPPEQPGKAV